MTRFILISLLILLPVADGTRDGRNGNRAYADGRYEHAAESYRDALRSLRGDEPSAYALQHNLGAALYRSGDVEQAREAFDAAYRGAASAADRARAAYNAGNAALAMSDYASAAEHFRRALRERPNDEDARFNYEFARRRIPPESEPEQGMSDDAPGDGEDDETDHESDDGRQSADENERPGDEDDAEPSDDGGPETDDDPGAPQQQSPGERSEELTREQAEQILGALQQGEQRLLREIQKAPFRSRHVEKDW